MSIIIKLVKKKKNQWQRKIWKGARGKQLSLEVLAKNSMGGGVGGEIEQKFILSFL